MPSAGGSGAASSVPAPSADGMGEFVCSLPINGAATVGLAHIANVQTTSDVGLDEIAFSFSEGTPEFTIQAATPPYLADPSGLPIEVQGETALQLTLNGGTRVSEDGSLTYDGSTNISVEFPVLRQLVEAGDFEAVSTWFIGLSSTADPCLRVRLSAEPNALIIEFQTLPTDY